MVDSEYQNIRIGHGFDVHRFTEGDHVTLGGIKIPHNKALEAHSDGDVVIHAICDALLGAIAAGDIGRHFPDTDSRYKNIDSCILLEKVYQQVFQQGYCLGNLDVTVIAQAPVLSKHIPSMCERLAEVMKVSGSQINIKATTTERLGYIGREEGIAVHSVVIVNKVSN
jgi:2-C-methyl-D-erythritol 2,4-cyclodiphosphate synthase